MFMHTQTYKDWWAMRRLRRDCYQSFDNLPVCVASVNRSKYNFGSLHTALISFNYLEDRETYGGCVLYMNACLLVLHFFFETYFSPTKY
jgi:hypothetical protein